MIRKHLKPILNALLSVERNLASQRHFQDSNSESGPPRKFISPRSSTPHPFKLLWINGPPKDGNL